MKQTWVLNEKKTSTTMFHDDMFFSDFSEFVVRGMLFNAIISLH